MGKVTDVRRQYADALQDISSLLEKAGAGSPAVRNDAIAAALDRYSERLPISPVQEYSSTPSGLYALPSVVEPITLLATPWEDGFSRLISIEFPVDQLPPIYLREKSYDFKFSPSPTGKQIYITSKPTGTLRVRFTARHVQDVTGDKGSWPSAHSMPIGQWAAVIACEWFGTRYAHSVESNNDGVNWRTKSQEIRSAGKELMARVEAALKTSEVAIWADLQPARISAQRRY